MVENRTAANAILRMHLRMSPDEGRREACPTSLTRFYLIPNTRFWASCLAAHHRQRFSDFELQIFVRPAQASSTREAVSP